MDALVYSLVSGAWKRRARTVTVGTGMNGRRLWHTDEGEGPPVVLMHGLGDSHGLWRYQVPVLRERFRTIAVDLPGHGQSELPAGKLTIDGMAQSVLALCDTLALEHPVFVGLSMGGGVAQSIAVTEPDRPSALVLVSTSSEFPPATRERFRSRADVAEREGMLAVIEETVPRWFTPEYREEHPEEVELTRRTVLATDPAAFAAASRANAERDFVHRLAEIRCPVLYVGGDQDSADPGRSVPIYRSHVRQVEIEMIAGVSHLLPVEASETFNRILLAFLERVTGSAASG
jgi:3-oxoadipate enol-lactonase